MPPSVRTAAAADEPFEPSVGQRASPLANVPGDIAPRAPTSRSYAATPRDAVRFASQALAERREGEWMLDAIARAHLAVAEWLRGRLDEAARRGASIDQWRAAGEHDLAAFGCYYLARSGALRAGWTRRSVPTGRRWRSRAADRPALPAVGVAYVGMAEVAYQRGELDTARRQVTEGIALCRQFVYTLPLATGLATLAWIRQAEGDAAGALDAMSEAERVTPGPGVTTLLNPVPAQRARLLLAQGDLAAAAEWTAKRGLGAHDEPDYPREAGVSGAGAGAARAGRPELALRLLQRLQALAIAQGRTGSIIEIQALRALALAAGGEQATAVVCLAEALTLGLAAGLRAGLRRRGHPDGHPPRPTRRLPTQRPGRRRLPLDYLTRLLLAVDTTPPAPHPGPGAAAAAGLIDALTAREQEVLALLAAGKANRRIAAELVITLDTVKKHVGHLLDKLGATNRTEAVARARQLGLIS